MDEEKFKDNFYYCHNSGKIKNKVTHAEIKKRVVEPTEHNRGGPYVRVYFKRADKFYHRVVWLLCNGEWPKYTIDHIDGNSLNNRIENLRDIPIHENNRNKSKYSKNKTGFKGVRFEKGSYRAQITFNSKTYYLGKHKTPEDAARAYDEKVIELLGEKAKTNFTKP